MLPDVIITKDRNQNQSNGLITKYDLWYPRNNQAGGVTIYEHPEIGEAHLGIWVYPQGRGYGLVTYLWAITSMHKKGYDFTNDRWIWTSAQAVKVWERFMEKGVTEVVQPFVQLSERGSRDHVGHIVIPKTVTLG